MEPQKAVRLIEETCYRMASRIDGEILAKRYNEILSEETLSSFPGSRDSKEVEDLDKRLENVVHWIIFDAGMDMMDIGSYRKSRRVVYSNGFNPDKIPKVIKKYRQYIGNLADYM